MSEQAVPPGTKGVKRELTLSDGTQVVIYNGTGRHVRDAGRIADVAKEGVMGYQLALASLLCTFNGQMRTYEDVLEMDMDHTLMLMGAVSGKDVTAVTASSSRQPTSPN